MISPEVPSITKIWRQIHLLNKTYVIPEYEHIEKEVITFSRTELAPADELKSNSIVLEAGMTMKGIDKYRVKWIMVDTGATRNILYILQML